MMRRADYVACLDEMESVMQNFGRETLRKNFVCGSLASVVPYSNSKRLRP
jgi:hypothetical protein